MRSRFWMFIYAPDRTDPSIHKLKALGWTTPLRLDEGAMLGRLNQNKQHLAVHFQVVGVIFGLLVQESHFSCTLPLFYSYYVASLPPGARHWTRRTIMSHLRLQASVTRGSERSLDYCLSSLIIFQRIPDQPRIVSVPSGSSSLVPNQRNSRIFRKACKFQLTGSQSFKAPALQTCIKSF